MFNDLREFLQKAGEAGLVTRVEGADWDLEIGSITELQQSLPDTSLLLFDHIKGYPPGYRIITNFANNDLLMNFIMGFPPETRRLGLVKLWKEKFREGIKPIPPVYVDSGPIMENVHMGDEVDLFEFPTPKWREIDGGRYIGTGVLVVQKDPDDGWVNCGTYRVQIQDKNTATVFISPGKHGDIIRRKYWEKGQSCPVAVVCGADPLLLTAGCSAVPWGVSEYDLTGGLGNRAVKVIKSKIYGLPIPAGAEIVLEGKLLPPGVDDRLEGPFAEYTGYATDARQEPSFKVECVMHRNDPVITGNPPIVSQYHSEMKSIADAANLWNELDKHVPGIRGVWPIKESGSVGITVISLKQMYAGHAKTAGLFAAGFRTQAEAYRYFIVVDEDIDPSKSEDLLWAIGQRSDPAESIDIIRGLSNSPLNPMTTKEMRAKRNYVHSRAIILACKPFEWINEFPASIKVSEDSLKKTREKWGWILYGEK